MKKNNPHRIRDAIANARPGQNLVFDPPEKTQMLTFVLGKGWIPKKK